MDREENLDLAILIFITLSDSYAQDSIYKQNCTLVPVPQLKQSDKLR